MKLLWSALSLLGSLVGLAFIILKVTGVIAWPWALVLIPFLPAALLGVAIIVLLVVGSIGAFIAGFLFVIGKSIDRKGVRK